jgi:hypothetical protein
VVSGQGRTVQPKYNTMEIKFRSELGRLLEYFNLPRIVAELGCAEGLYSKQICEWGIDRFFMIDNWETIKGQVGDGGVDNSWHSKNYGEAVARVKPWEDKVTIMKGLTKETIPIIPDNYLGMVYIDAAHDYDNVLNDLKLSFPKVVSGGIISGHDYLNMSYGVNKAVNDFCKSKGLQINLVPDEEPAMASFWFIKR